MRLIDADALILASQQEGAYGYVDAKEIADAPTIDAVPVVRCKDCKWFGKIGCAIKVVDETDKPKENDFCSFAERRNNATD